MKEGSLIGISDFTIPNALLSSKEEKSTKISVLSLKGLWFNWTVSSIEIIFKHVFALIAQKSLYSSLSTVVAQLY